MSENIKIFQCTDGSGNPIAPLTTESAVYDENGKRLSDKLKDVSIERIKEAQDNAISAIVNQKVIPEMLSESTLQLINTAGGGTIINAPDDEDITSIDNGSTGSKVLKFSNRPYNPIGFSGKGYKILRRNLVNQINVLTQDLISDDNTLYEIRYDFELENNNIIIPENSILFFHGGTLNNGTITCNNTDIIGLNSFIDGGSANFTGTFRKGLIMNIDDNIMWYDGTDWRKIESEDYSAKVVDVKETVVPEASVEVINRELQFTFGIPKGEKGDKGDPGIDAVGGRTVFAFKSSQEIPGRPTGGSWNIETNVVTPPEGWENNSSGLEHPIWMSNCIFGSDGLPETEWSFPVKITGDDGQSGTNGEDGNSLQFIYKRTSTESVKPERPTDMPTDNFTAPAGWNNHPEGVDTGYKAEWVCTAVKMPGGIWQDWEGPYLWSNYGVSGTDGDGVLYSYKRTTTPINPGQPDGNGSTGTPSGWENDPIGVDAENPYEWVTVSRYSGDSKSWSSWSTPSLWAKYGENGKSSETRYALTNGSDDVPVVIKDNINPGSIWQSNIPVREDRSKAIWGIQAVVSTENTLIGEWSDPYLMTGVDGSDGQDGTPIDYKIYVYKLSASKPSSKPTGTDPNNPGDGWVDYPNTTGQWWQCIGSVSGSTGQVTEWSEILPLNGKDGVAQDGKRTEFRFQKNNSQTEAPGIENSVRTPSGWELNPPEITSGEFLWMSLATINPDDTIEGLWSDPVRISGEQGPQGDKGEKGDTGPAGSPGEPGSQGVSGIPGKFIEIRFCLGTDSTYDGTTTPENTREPVGWTISTPEVTPEKPYIWFIQATINFSSNEDQTGTVSGEWSKPCMLSGKNGLDGTPGADGRRGQVVYPMGIYSTDVTYTATETQAPYVYDSLDGNFYVLNTIGSWLGSEHENKQPSQATETWQVFEGFEALYTKIGIIGNGLVGSAVFNGDYMFSQQGLNQEGGESSDYHLFNGDLETSPFKPNFLLDFKKGDITYRGDINTIPYTMKSGETLVLSADFKYKTIITSDNCKIDISTVESSIDSLNEVIDFTIIGKVGYIKNPELEQETDKVFVNYLPMSQNIKEFSINQNSYIRLKKSKINISTENNNLFGFISFVINQNILLVTVNTIFGETSVQYTNGLENGKMLGIPTGSDSGAGIDTGKWVNCLYPFRVPGGAENIDFFTSIKSFPTEIIKNVSNGNFIILKPEAQFGTVSFSSNGFAGIYFKLPENFSSIPNGSTVSFVGEIGYSLIGYNKKDSW